MNSDWTTHALYDLAVYRNGRAFKPSESTQNGLPIVKIAELNRGITDVTDRYEGPLDDRHVIHDGNLLFAWSGTVGIHIWRGSEAALNQHIFKVRAYSELVDQRFLREGYPVD